MIKFFRTLRRSLLAEGKTTRYLKYALGEVILVVIGIVIALQLNNWNEQQKLEREAHAVLENLHQNFIQAKSQSEALLLKEEKSIDVLILVLGIGPNRKLSDLETISDTVFKNAFWQLENDVPIINSYVENKESGKIALIQNKALRERFTQLEFDQNTLKEMINDRLRVHQLRVDGIVEMDFNYIRLVKSMVSYVDTDHEKPNDYQKILADQRVRNLLGVKLAMTDDVYEYRKNLDKEIATITKMIEDELNGTHSK